MAMFNSTHRLRGCAASKAARYLQRWKTALLLLGWCSVAFAATEGQRGQIERNIPVQVDARQQVTGAERRDCIRHRRLWNEIHDRRRIAELYRRR